MCPDGKQVNSRRPSRRAVALGSTVATVLVLAGVIYGLAAVSSPRDPDDAPVISLADQSERLTDQAMDALESGDETAAAALLQKAVSVDPTNSRARDELTRIVESKTPQSEDEDPEPERDNDSQAEEPDFDPDAGFLDPVNDLGALLPSSVEGYELGLVTVVDTDANVPADPTEDGPFDVITRALFSVHDFETAEKAEAFVVSVSRTAFPENAADVTVDGVPAYFGTDGVRFATVSYSRGRYAFEVIITTGTGAPGALLDASVSAAAAFPDSL